MNFSTVYLAANQRILAPRDSPIAKAADLSGKRVCAVKGTTSLHRIQEIDPPPIIVEVVTWADCLVALQQRQVDAVSTDDSILAGLVAQDPYLHIVGPSMAEEPYGIGINLENTGLVRFVNGTLDRIRRDGTWNTLYRKWLTVLGPRARAAGPEVLGLMSTAGGIEDDPGTRHASSTDLEDTRRWIRRRRCGRWPPRRCSARTSTTPTAPRSAPPTPNPQDQLTDDDAGAVADPPARRRPGGDPAGAARSIRWPR